MLALNAAILTDNEVPAKTREGQARTAGEHAGRPHTLLRAARAFKEGCRRLVALAETRTLGSAEPAQQAPPVRFERAI